MFLLPMSSFCCYGNLTRFKAPVFLYYWPCQCGTSAVVLHVACFDVSLCTVSPSVYLNDVKLGLGS